MEKKFEFAEGKKQGYPKKKAHSIIQPSLLNMLNMECQNLVGTTQNKNVRGQFFELELLESSLGTY